MENLIANTGRDNVYGYSRGRRKRIQLQYHPDRPPGSTLKLSGALRSPVRSIFWRKER